MTPAPGLRGHGAAARTTRQRQRFAVPLVVAAAAVLLLAGACAPIGSGTATPPPTETPTAASGSPGPKTVSWPASTIAAAVALGGADGEFKNMNDDISAAVNSQDPARIMTAMNDALAFLQENQQSIPKLQAYVATKSVGDRLAAAYATMIQGLTKVKDGLTAGDAKAIEDGFTTYAQGSAAYASVQPDLGDIAQQAIVMTRLLSE